MTHIGRRRRTGGSAPRARAGLRESLRRLGTGHVDVHCVRIEDPRVLPDPEPELRARMDTV